MYTKEQINAMPSEVRFELVGNFVNQYFEVGTNIPVLNIKGDTEIANVYQRKTTKGVKTYRYLYGVNTIDYDEQIKLGYPTIEQDKKQLRNPLNTIKFSKRMLIVNREMNPSLFDFLINSPNEKSSAAETGSTAKFEVILPAVKAQKKIETYSMIDKAVDIVNKMKADKDQTLFSSMCAFFNIDSNADPDTKFIQLREKAQSAPDLIIKAVKNIESSNFELIQFGLDLGLIIQTKNGFDKANGEQIKRWSLADKSDSEELKKKFAKWLSTDEGEAHKAWLKQEMIESANKKAEGLFIS